MKIAISAESTIDLTPELLKEYDIKVLPYKIILGANEFTDGVDVNPEKIFEFVRENKVLPKTTAINEVEYTEFFEGLLKEYDAVIHFCLSSAISSACSHAVEASKKLDNVFVVDTKSLSTGIALLAIDARKLAESGKRQNKFIREKQKELLLCKQVLLSRNLTICTRVADVLHWRCLVQTCCKLDHKLS